MTDFDDFVAVQLERAGEAAEDAWLADSAAGLIASWREFAIRTAGALARGEISEHERLTVLAMLDDEMAQLEALIAEMRR